MGVFHDVPVASGYIQLQGGHPEPTGLQSVPAEDSLVPPPYLVLRVLNVVSKHRQNHLGGQGETTACGLAFEKICNHFSPVRLRLSFVKNQCGAINMTVGLRHVLDIT